MKLLNKLSDFNVLKDNPKKILISVCTPLVICYLISVFTTSVTNTIYSRFCPEYFTVYGMISVAIVSLQMIMGCVINACWIKTSYYYNVRTSNEQIPYFANAVYSIVFVEFILVAILFSIKNLLFKWFNVPDEYYQLCNVYFIVSVLAYVIPSIAIYFSYIVSGVGKPSHLFICTLITQSGTMVVSGVLLGLFKGGIVGAALIIPTNFFIVLCFTLLVFKIRKIDLPKTKVAFRLDFKLIGSFLATALFMAFQSVMCQIGEFCVSYQTNNLLDINYRTMLGVTLLPFNLVFNSFSTATVVFVPANYKAGLYDRVKSFIKLTTIVTLIYSFICAIAYTSIGRWYFSTLFTDEQIINYGAYYWCAYGIAYIPGCLIYVLRFYLDSVGKNKAAMVTGFMQMVGAMLGAFWLIPSFGTIGRSWTQLSTWLIPAVYLIIACLFINKKVFTKKQSSIPTE
ncbi:MAG: MATE family efflux transporter [Clostridia bacterium]|nr:MATE family efflux transporter [Clostridia bacterium]